MPACLPPLEAEWRARVSLAARSIAMLMPCFLLREGFAKSIQERPQLHGKKHAPRRTQNLSGNVFLGCAEKRRKRPIPRQIKPQPVERIRDGLCRRHSPEADMAPAPLAPPRADGRTRLTGLTAGGEGFMFSCGC